MSDTKNIQEQRDLFLAFAFASADLFLEIDEDGKISYATGAAKSLTGINYESLLGQDWLTLFSRQDLPVLLSARKKASVAERCGPFHVQIYDEEGKQHDAIATGIRMPDSKKFHLALGFPSDLLIKMAGILREQQELHLLDKDGFLRAANEAFDVARSIGEGVDITLLDIPNTKSIKEKIGDDKWDGFTSSITELLCSSSVDGQAAAQIDDGRYSVIHDQNIDSDTLRSEIQRLGMEVDPEGEGFEIESKAIAADLQSLSERETTKALIYTINEFERKGTSLNIETLNSSFKAYVSANAQRIHHFKSMIEQLSFDIDFQPIVDVDALNLSHFEILSRFKGEGSTQEWIIFGEDIGLAADFDIAVCERVINYLLYKAADNRFKFALNLSGQSIQNEQFFKTLLAKLDLHQELAQRMIFEITESTTIVELEMVNNFIETLQERGYKVCLDDFGAGASSFKYLQQLHVDYIKIDGQYTNKILYDRRDQVVVKNLAQMCRDLDIGVIAERIESNEQLEKMRGMGIGYGQGYYFGYPHSIPQFDPDHLPAQPPQQ